LIFTPTESEIEKVCCEGLVGGFSSLDFFFFLIIKGLIGFSLVVDLDTGRD